MKHFEDLLRNYRQYKVFRRIQGSNISKIFLSQDIHRILKKLGSSAENFHKRFRSAENFNHKVRSAENSPALVPEKKKMDYVKFSVDLGLSWEIFLIDRNI